MALTVGSMVIRATWEQCNFIAECANLTLYIFDRKELEKRSASWDAFLDEMQALREHNRRAEDGNYWMWADAQTFGGGCRITFYRGIVWISAHYGYPQADITRDVAELFAELGCKPVNDRSIEWASPLSYGVERINAVLD